MCEVALTKKPSEIVKDKLRGDFCPMIRCGFYGVWPRAVGEWPGKRITSSHTEIAYE